MTDHLPPTETGENILWHGRPSARIVYGPGEIILAAVGAILWLYLLGGYVIVGDEGVPGVGVALVFLVPVASFMVVGYPALSAYRRGHTRYALTSTRALISTDDSRNWTSYPVERWTPLSLVGTRPPTVYFANRVVMSALRTWGKNPGPPTRVDVGFTHIAEAEKVFDLMRELARPTRAADHAGHAPPGWENFLDAGETILWQGRPYPGVILRGKSLIMIVTGAIFLLIPAVFHLASFLLASKVAISNRDAVVAFPFVVIGLAAIFVAPQMGAYYRRNCWYTLTDRRAVIATQLFGQRSLDSYAVKQWSHLALKNTRPPSVHFRSQTILSSYRASYNDIGFDHIEEGAHVYEMMRRLMDGAA